MKNKLAFGCILVLVAVVCAISYFGYSWVVDQQPEPVPTVTTTNVPRNTSTNGSQILPKNTPLVTEAAREEGEAVVMPQSLSVWKETNYDGYPVAWLYLGAEVLVGRCEGVWAYVGIGWVKSKWLDPNYCEVK